MQIASALRKVSDIIFKVLKDYALKDGAILKVQWVFTSALSDRCCKIHILPYVLLLLFIWLLYVPPPVLKIHLFEYLCCNYKNKNGKYNCDKEYRDIMADLWAVTYHFCIFMLWTYMFAEQSSEHGHSLWEMACLPAVGAFGEERFWLFVRCLEGKCRPVKPSEVKPSALRYSCLPQIENLIAWIKNWNLNPKMWLLLDPKLHNEYLLDFVHPYT